MQFGVSIAGCILDKTSSTLIKAIFFGFVAIFGIVVVYNVIEVFLKQNEIGANEIGANCNIRKTKNFFYSPENVCLILVPATIISFFIIDGQNFTSTTLWLFSAAISSAFTFTLLPVLYALCFKYNAREEEIANKIWQKHSIAIKCDLF
jgi:hypothetical protein